MGVDVVDAGSRGVEGVRASLDEANGGIASTFSSDR